MLSCLADGNRPRSQRNKMTHLALSLDRNDLGPEARAVAKSTFSTSTLLFVGLTFLAFALKICMALLTFGTNDVVTFFLFASKLSAHGLAWTIATTSRLTIRRSPLTTFVSSISWIVSRFCATTASTFPFCFDCLASSPT
jgi:hypothetical protein